MPKSYLWLATGHLGFIKLIGHLIKMLCYLLEQNKAKKNRKQKVETGKKEKLKLAQPPSPLGPTYPFPRPSPLSPLVVYLRRGKQLRGMHADAGEVAEPPRPPQASSAHHDTHQEPPQ